MVWIKSKNKTFTIKETHTFPKGISPGLKQSVRDYWLLTRGIDLYKPQYTIYNIAEQKKEQKLKQSLDRRALKSTNTEGYYKNCDYLRSLGYDYTDLGVSTGNWKHILEREKELKRKGYKTKVSKDEYSYILWWKR